MFPSPSRTVQQVVCSSTPGTCNFTATSANDVIVLRILSPLANNVSINLPAGYTNIAGSASGNAQCQVFAKRSAGGESSVGLTTSNGASRTIEVSAEVYTAAQVATGALPVFGSASALGFDPPNLAPSPGTKDYRWGTCCTCQGGGPLVAPANYTLDDTTFGVARWASRSLNASSQNPGAWTGGAGDSDSITIAIQGAPDPDPGGGGVGALMLHGLV